MPINDDELVKPNQYSFLTALVVDDHGPMVKIIRSKLVAIGFKNIFIALNGHDALKIVEQNNIDLIISDWNMPKMNGLELLQEIRKNSGSAKIPFIMLTANINHDDVKKAIFSGVSEYLIKPFNRQSLELKVGSAFASPLPKNSQNNVPTKVTTEIKALIKPTKITNSILIVDDEPNNISVFTELLKGEFNLQACLSGAKALEICNQEQLPDLILLDIMMPEMNGLDVCKELKTNPLTEHIPVIFISALSQTKDIVKGLSIGAVDYITKPIIPEITLARINTHMKQVNQRVEMASQLDTMIENMRLKEDIERITHHDLKNPLAVIISAAETLKSQQTYSEQEVDFITDSAITMQKMIDEKMIIHQLENNSTQHNLIPVNALNLLNKIVYGQRKNCENHRVYVKYKIPKNINFLGNQVLCFNMLNNLLTNAIEASPINGDITISMVEKTEYVILNINNKGMIPEKIQARFFDKFITYGKENGTGLGTYSAKLSALAQGGDISFSSTKENGTTLTVSLKIAP